MLLNRPPSVNRETKPSLTAAGNLIYIMTIMYCNLLFILLQHQLSLQGRVHSQIFINIIKLTIIIL